VDTYANGLGAPILSDDSIWDQCCKSLTVFARLLENYVPPADTLF
jgi:hypothetical protein